MTLRRWAEATTEEIAQAAADAAGLLAIQPIGVVGDPAGASAEAGAAVVEHWTSALAEALAEIAAFAFPARGPRPARREARA